MPLPVKILVRIRGSLAGKNYFFHLIREAFFKANQAETRKRQAFYFLETPAVCHSCRWTVWAFQFFVSVTGLGIFLFFRVLILFVLFFHENTSIYRVHIFAKGIPFDLSK